MKLSTKTIVAIFAIFPIGMISSSTAQEENLVPNAGFETIEGKLKALGCIENATGWTSPTGARADIFTPTKTVEINTPDNIYGKEDAKEGTNYAGVVAYSYGDAMARTYLMAKLTTPLKKGMKYCVKFNLSLAEASKYSSNQIGVNFNSKPFGTDSKTAILDKTHVLDPKNKVFSAMYNWEQVCGIYYAEGGEKYITIGNFTSNENTKNEKNKKDPNMKKAVIIAAYYYIDDVSVTMITEDAVCDCAVQEEVNQYSTTVYQKVVTLNDNMPANEQVDMQKAYYAFGSSKLNPAGTQALDLIAKILQANPGMNLEVTGHSDAMEDSVGIEKPVYADMSNKRINEVIIYLKSKGIAESRIIPNPAGNSIPNEEIKELDDADLKQAKNRRVSFKARS